MTKRIAMIAAMAMSLLLGAGIARAASTNHVEGGVPGSAAAHFEAVTEASGTAAFDIPGVGFITLDAEAETLTVLQAESTGGYTVSVDTSEGDDVSVTFTGETESIEFTAWMTDDSTVAAHVCTTMFVDLAASAAAEGTGEASVSAAGGVGSSFGGEAVTGAEATTELVVATDSDAGTSEDDGEFGVDADGAGTLTGGATAGTEPDEPPSEGVTSASGETEIESVTYAAASAGLVTIESNVEGLAATAIELNSGWSYRLAASTDDYLALVFTSADQMLTLHASRDDSGLTVWLDGDIDGSARTNIVGDISVGAYGGLSASVDG